MPIQVRCECGRQFKVAEEHAGKRGQCPGCGKKIVIPAAPAPTKGPAPAAAKAGPSKTIVKAAPVKTVPVSAPPPPAADEGFEGVADLLNETLAAPPLASPALAAWPAAEAEKSSRRKKKGVSLGAFFAGLGDKAVGLGVILVLVAITAGCVWGGMRFYKSFQYSSAVSGDDSEAALYAIASDLPYTVSHVNSIDLEAEPTKRKRMQNIARLLPSLPEATEIGPLLEMRTDRIPYMAAFEVVRSRAKVPWLIEKSCESNADVRRFAAEALRPTFPFNKLDDAGFAQLKEATSVDQKQALYDKLYADLHRPYEQKLVGNYQLQIEAIWQNKGNEKEGKTVVTPQPRLAVACNDYLWKIDFYGQTWTGKIDNFPQLALTVPVPKTDQDLTELPNSQKLAATQLRLSWQDDQLAISVDGLPAYAPVTRGSVPVRSGADSRFVDPRIPAGAHTEYDTIYQNGQIISQSVVWTLPERPGFAKFDIRLVRVGQP